MPRRCLRHTAALATAGFFATNVHVAATDQTAGVGPESVWQPGTHFMQVVHEQCAKKLPEEYADCLIGEMPAAGAPADAVAFTRRLQKRTGQVGYLLHFRATGRIAVAYVYYPLRANENQGWLLVNGTPPLIDVDDPSLFPKEALQADPYHATLASRYPRIAVFPGERSDTRYPEPEPLAGGGQRFVVRYRLQDGCHACERVGSANVAFDFDQRGQLLGTRLLSVERQCLSMLLVGRYHHVGRLSLQEVLDVLDRAQEAVADDLRRLASVVRRQYDVGQGQNRIVRLKRLIVENIQSGGELALTERVQQSGPLDEGTTARIDQDGSSPQQRQFTRGEEAVRLGPEAQVERDDVGLAQNLVL
jgi:hypothetical protein